jgi:hypothetical protein
MWVLLANPGLLNLWMWSTMGMEGNVMGLAFRLILFFTLQFSSQRMAEVRLCVEKIPLRPCSRKRIGSN